MGIFYQPPPPIVAANTAQPYAHGNLNPSIEAVEVDNPPPLVAGTSVFTISLLAQLAQPDPFQWAGMGGLQPYARRLVDANDLAVAVNNPIPISGGPTNAAQLAANQAQPDPWIRVELGAGGGLQPYAGRQINPSVINVPTNPPPPDRRSVQSMATVNASWIIDLPPVVKTNNWQITINPVVVTGKRNRAIIIG